MAGQRTLPGIGLVSYWELSDDTYKPDMDANFAKLSILVQARALSRTTALPGTPQPNAIYIVPANASSQANKIAYVDEGAYRYLDPAPGMRVFLQDLARFVYWSGTAWVEEDGAERFSIRDLNDVPSAYGEPGQVLAVNPTKDGLIWIDAALPIGGTQGQILARGPDNTLVWIDPPTGGGSEFVEEAPTDGVGYVRKDGSWVPEATGGPAGVEEAPTDGNLYGRQNGDWVEVPDPPAAPDLSTFVDSGEVDHMVYLTQAAYDALATKNVRTLYLIPVA